MQRERMVLLLSFSCAVLLLLSYFSRRYANPFKLIFLFGKKGSGKSCYMVRQMLKYRRKGWHVYTDMEGVLIPGVRFFDSKDLASFRPEPYSALFLDEVGISMDARDFKRFPPGLRDFFKYVRKMKCVVYMNSQSFDVDKKVRDTTDGMALLVAIAGCITLYRPIVRSVALVEASAAGESRIADNLRFRSVFSWRLLWMPFYFRYFDTAAMPDRPALPYREVFAPDVSKSISEVIYDVFRPARSWFRKSRR